MYLIGSIIFHDCISEPLAAKIWGPIEIVMLFICLSVFFFFTFLKCSLIKYIFLHETPAFHSDK